MAHFHRHGGVEQQQVDNTSSRFPAQVGTQMSLYTISDIVQER